MSPDQRTYVDIRTGEDVVIVNGTRFAQRGYGSDRILRTANWEIVEQQDGPPDPIGSRIAYAICKSLGGEFPDPVNPHVIERYEPGQLVAFFADSIPGLLKRDKEYTG